MADTAAGNIENRTKKCEVLIAFDLVQAGLDRIRSRFPQVLVRHKPCTSAQQVTEALGRADVLFAYLAGIDPAQATQLRWIQLTGAGFDHLHGKSITQANITVTNAPVFAQPIAEYVMASLLMARRDLARIWREFRASRAWPADHWATHAGHEVAGLRMGVVGYGRIGQAIAQLGHAFSMEVVATRASADQPSWDGEIRVLPARDLATLLATSDVVVLSVPLTPATEHLIGAQELAQMKHGAYLINIARGAVVDEDALFGALHNHLGGAILDVFGDEPLPASSKWFDLPNVWLTPHIAGVSSAYWTRIVDLFCDNLQRYLTGQELHHVVMAGARPAQYHLQV